MTDFAGIQLGSPMVANFSLPLDRKTLRATLVERNSLTATQRWLGMIWYCQEDDKWYKLITNPAGELDDSDRSEFWVWGWPTITTWEWVPSSTPDAIWDEYLDTNTNTWYKAVWITSASDRQLL